MLFRFKHFQSRLLFFLLSLLLIVLILVYYLVNRQNLDTALDIIVTDLQMEANNFNATIENRNESLAIAADALSADFAFKQVYAAGDQATLLSAMNNLLNRLSNADFMVLVSRDNRILADTRGRDRLGETPGWLPVIEQARQLVLTGQYPEAADVAVIDGNPYHLTILPFLNPDIEAWIALAFELGQDFTDEFKESISAEVSVVFRGENGVWNSNASTLPFEQLSALLSDFNSMLPASREAVVRNLAGEDFVMLSQTIVNTGDTVQVVLQRSLSEQLAPYRALNTTLLVIFAAGMIILFIGVVFISRKVTRPVLKLADSAEKIGAGDYSQSVDITLLDEIGQLAKAFNQMAGSLAEKEKQLNKLAHYDPLTNLPNRLLLSSRIDHAIHRARRTDTKLAVLYLDLDDFKNVNDSLGHSLGDQLLIQVAHRFRARVREEDTIARLGGDEFVVIAESIASPEAAAALGESLLNCLDRPFGLSDAHTIFTSACIGISIYPDNGDNIEVLMRKADTAMYRAKQKGRNKLTFYSPEMGAKAAEQLELITALRHALERREFTVFFQPTAHTQSGDFTGAEALIRWRHPQKGLVSPAKFIPLAEQAGLINPLGSFMLNEVAGQMKDWIAKGMYPGIISVNVSVKQFRDQNLVKLISDAFEEHNIPPSLLALEITETALMDDPVKVGKTLAELKKLGVKIYLDDFGTGFLSFSYLSQFDIDVLKIDISFIRNINKSDKDNQIILSMINIAHNLGMEVIAEGVETAVQLEFLSRHRCEKYQGYLISQALPVEEYIAMAERQKRDEEISRDLGA